jgi:ribosomal protein L13E
LEDKEGTLWKLGWVSQMNHVQVMLKVLVLLATRRQSYYHPIHPPLSVIKKTKSVNHITCTRGELNMRGFFPK